MASLEEFVIIAVHFNPQRYNLPARNYWEWRHSLGDLEENLITVELSFDESFMIHDSVKVSGGPENILWQKEAMINLAIRSLPDRVKYVAWVDHDLIFDNAQWAIEALDQLSGDCDVVQLFETYSAQDEHREELYRRSSAVAALQFGPINDQYPAPGGAWAARRDYLAAIGGLAYSNIVGGGDQIACDTWTGQASHYLKRYAGKLAGFDLKWQQQARAERQGRTGLVRGNVSHLYHGTRERRKHVERAEILRRHNFDPEVDIRLGESGLLEWTGNKPQLAAEVAEYFQDRQEDS